MAVDAVRAPAPPDRCRSEVFHTAGTCMCAASAGSHAPNKPTSAAAAGSVLLPSAAAAAAARCHRRELLRPAGCATHCRAAQCRALLPDRHGWGALGAAAPLETANASMLEWPPGHRLAACVSDAIRQCGLGECSVEAREGSPTHTSAMRVDVANIYVEPRSALSRYHALAISPSEH
jgi:hypothetical protein